MNLCLYKRGLIREEGAGPNEFVPLKEILLERVRA
jgi:hypothetical protein